MRLLGNITRFHGLCISSEVCRKCILQEQLSVPQCVLGGTLPFCVRAVRACQAPAVECLILGTYI